MRSSTPAENDIAAGLAAGQCGETMAYKRALSALLPLVRRFAARQLLRYGQQRHAEDVVQETLMAIHLKLHTYDTAEPPLPWVYAIARFKAIDMLRRQRITDISIDDPDYVETANEDTDVNTSDTQRDLNSLLQQLAPPQGDIIYALKVEGTSITTLAARYGFSESKVKVIIHRGMKKLNEIATRSEKQVRAA